VESNADCIFISSLLRIRRYEICAHIKKDSKYESLLPKNATTTQTASDADNIPGVRSTLDFVHFCMGMP
jgi:hypothetical protein